jgi:hypothetical protein
MKKLTTILLLLLMMQSGLGFAQESLNEHLEPLRPYIGKTFKGEFIESTKEDPKFDISRWERALNGEAIRILHSLNDGEYGGETIIYWDKEKESLIFYYFTTAGFYTSGTITFEEGNMVSHELVSGNENGITEVKSTSEIMEDGKLKGSAMYFKNGEWIKGHEIIYVEDQDAKVIFN